ncbi:uncharacterized protein LOC129605043 isoform X2 [Betta splendens]|uniref:Uncharacterized protein LOC129605043 isoform X2 n=1 Tax=Betta splendens TaxID=158456 RepID=A0A9W2Y7Z8_BETSP|nr:uncharacterized protein LOC129605043 isoform X2 [Betta splendens]
MKRLFVVIQLVNNNNQHPPHVMSFRILTLISLISCVSGSLVVTVTQNHSITLEWTFTPKPDTITSVYIYCQLLTGLRASVLLHLHEGVEVSESQDQQFSGRVQFDRDELRDGRIRLQVSRLRTEDSGLYLCGVRTADGWSIGRCRLNVTGELTEPLLTHFNQQVIVSLFFTYSQQQQIGLNLKQNLGKVQFIVQLD